MHCNTRGMTGSCATSSAGAHAPHCTARLVASRTSRTRCQSAASFSRTPAPVAKYTSSGVRALSAECSITERQHRATPAPPPTRRGRFGDSALRRQTQIAGLAHEPLKTVIVGSTWCRAHPQVMTDVSCPVQRAQAASRTGGVKKWRDSAKVPVSPPEGQGVLVDSIAY